MTGICTQFMEFLLSLLFWEVLYKRNIHCFLHLNSENNSQASCIPNRLPQYTNAYAMSSLLGLAVYTKNISQTSTYSKH